MQQPQTDQQQANDQAGQTISLITYDPNSHGLVTGGDQMLVYEVVAMPEGQQVPEGAQTATLVPAGETGELHAELQPPAPTMSRKTRQQSQQQDFKNESVYDFPEPSKADDEEDDEEDEEDEDEDEEEDGDLDDEDEEDDEDDESMENAALISNANQMNSNKNNNLSKSLAIQQQSQQGGQSSSSTKKSKKKSGSGGHVCNYCSYTTHKRYLLSRHMKSHSEDRPHRCGICERGFKTAASLQNHVNTHSGVRPHSCKLCDAQFTTSGELVRHIRYKHTHEKPHKCPECDYASVELSKLKRHMRCHTGERPYQCQHCTYASPDTYKLKRHLRIHTGEKPYECNVCHARFTQSNSLKAHKLIHSGNKPVYRCDKCPATCGRKTDLRIHVQKLHTADKPLTCRRCDKTYPDRYQYKLHLKTHEGEKCFKCELCAYSSVSARHLESHMLIHTDKKPFACDQCDQSFRQKQLLKRHRNLYHNPSYIAPTPREKTHECHVCNKAFRHKGNLIRHLSMHDPNSKSNTNTSERIDEDESSGATTIEGGSVEDNKQSVSFSYDPNNHQLVSSLSTSSDQMLLYEVVSTSNPGQEGSAPMTPANLPPSAEFEAQVQGRIKEEKQKDVSECFGFKDDDEEDEAILSMPSNALN